MPSFAAQHSLFRAYDIRGDEQYFTPDFIKALGSAFVRLYKSYHAAKHGKLIANGDTANSDICKSHAKPHHTPKETTVIIGYDVRCDSASTGADS